MDNQNILNMIISGEISEAKFFGNKDKVVIKDMTAEETKIILNAYGVKDIPTADRKEK